MSLNPLSISIKQVVGNIILFIPLGFYAPLVWFKIRRLKQVVLIGLLTSLGIEVIQMLISLIIGVRYRSFVVDDIILNTIGVILGYFIFKKIIPILEKSFDVIDDHNGTNKKFINFYIDEINGELRIIDGQDYIHRVKWNKIVDVRVV